MTDKSTPSKTHRVGWLTDHRLAATIVIALTLFSGVVHGYLDGRWSTASNQKNIGEKLHDLPSHVGDWELKAQEELNPKAAKILRCYNSNVRTYHNPELGVDVSVAILFGPRGPIAVHKPEICYSSIGTKQAGETKKKTIATKSSKHELWAVQFSSQPDPTPTLDVWYAWSDGGAFQARKYPRFWLTDSLYKIQVQGPIGSEAQRPCADFLAELLPHVEKVIQ